MCTVATTGADAEDADAVWVDAGRRVERVDGVGDVFAAAVGIFEIAGIATARPLVGGVEHERGDAPGGEAGGVVRADLFLDAAAGGGEYHRAQRLAAGVVGQVQVGRELDRPAGDRQVLAHSVTTFRVEFVR
ncbi:hypothetical protein [Amycolatopsis sp. WQ 127309]|uniref:hypothetical protein n=1 Tax=Amycolatopsis sp. WQ 127309 TaxID=2932773 RepID=UPI001FF365DC|nr:hypothetical protein [Amycolatopsis sp. WQ 127309]UOZ05552.1 hypothetical protein MUY22_43110 [Amycolatopsis sp. WQ 127309]